MNLANCGDVAGAEVVQLYITDQQAGADRPAQSLKGFVKVHLEAGQSRRVSMRLPVCELAIFCPDANQWQIRGGGYLVRLGSSSRDIRLQQAFFIEEVKAKIEEAI